MSVVFSMSTGAQLNFSLILMRKLFMNGVFGRDRVDRAMKLKKVT
jgi:hypothetical protein